MLDFTGKQLRPRRAGLANFKLNTSRNSKNCRDPMIRICHDDPTMRDIVVIS